MACACASSLRRTRAAAGVSARSTCRGAHCRAAAAAPPLADAAQVVALTRRRCARRSCSTAAPVPSVAALLSALARRPASISSRRTSSAPPPTGAGACDRCGAERHPARALRDTTHRRCAIAAAVDAARPASRRRSRRTLRGGAVGHAVVCARPRAAGRGAVDRCARRGGLTVMPSRIRRAICPARTLRASS